MSEDAVWIVEDNEWPVEGALGYALHWTGRFSASHQTTDGNTEGPFGVTVDEAIAWGRTRSAEVYVQVSEVVYSAGTTLAPGLPEWPEGMIVEARTEVLPHEPWRDRTEDDDPIEWDVVLAPSAPPFTDDPAFETRFAEILAASTAVVIREAPRREGYRSRVAVRVSARTPEEARRVATDQGMAAFRTAIREQTRSSYGFVFGADPRPAHEA